jgi:hypothetical protein
MADIVFWVSLAGLFALAVHSFWQRHNIGHLLAWLAILAASGGWYFIAFDLSPHFQSKGEQSSTPAMVILYLCTVGGMACNYLYAHFMKPIRKREPFDFGCFIAPMFASPIIFAPLWSAFHEAGIELTALKFAAFFVAFENGFFWKEFFDNRRGQHS